MELGQISVVVPRPRNAAVAPRILEQLRRPHRAILVENDTKVVETSLVAPCGRLGSAANADVSVVFQFLDRIISQHHGGGTSVIVPSIKRKLHV